MSLKNLFFVTFFLFFITQSFAQSRNFEEYNLLGFNGGLTFFDIDTPNFETRQETGFIGGFTTRGTFYNSFDLIYGINFIGNNIGILGNDPLDIGSKDEYIKYAVQGVQIGVLASLNIIRHHLSLEAGPILNVNGKMKLKDESYENYIIDGYQTLRASDIQNISKVHFHLAGGLSTGIRNFRVSALYQYGVTNTLKNLNDLNLENSKGAFEGNSSTFVILGTIYL